MPAPRRRKTTTTSEPSERTGDFLNRLSDRISDRFGAESVTRLSDAKLYSAVKDYVSVCWPVDFAMHLPGAPTGRLITIVGAEASAKTSLALALLANTQKRGGIGMIIDTEYAIDKERCVLFGIDPTKLIVTQPETTEEAIGAVQEAIKEAQAYYEETGEDKLITVVLDSAAGAPTKAEMEEDDGEGGKAGAQHARLYSKALRKITRGIAKQRICLVIINQEKENVSYKGYSTGDATKTMVADKPLSFHSSVILTTHRIEILKNAKKEPIGIRTRVRVKKNKNAAPFSEAVVTITFTGGIDEAASILEIATQIGLIKKNRGWYEYVTADDETIKFQSGSFEKTLASFPEIMEKMDAFKSNLAAQDKAAEDAEPNAAEEDEDDDD